MLIVKVINALRLEAFNGRFEVKQPIVPKNQMTDASPPWRPLVIEALSVSVNCWSLVRVCLMTLGIAGSLYVINLMPLTTAHYGKHLICCKVLCVGKTWEAT